MPAAQFEEMVRGEFEKAIPERFLKYVQNVALLIEDEPSAEIRAEEGLLKGETLLGLYRGISLDRRGLEYGLGGTLPDTITLYRVPIMDEAQRLGGTSEALREVIRETIWHEVAHYFGFGEADVQRREDMGANHSV